MEGDGLRGGADADGVVGRVALADASGDERLAPGALQSPWPLEAAAPWLLIGGGECEAPREAPLARLDLCCVIRTMFRLGPPAEGRCAWDTTFCRSSRLMTAGSVSRLMKSVRQGSGGPNESAASSTLALELTWPSHLLVLLSWEMTPNPSDLEVLEPCRGRPGDGPTVGLASSLLTGVCVGICFRGVSPKPSRFTSAESLKLKDTCASGHRTSLAGCRFGVAQLGPAAAGAATDATTAPAKARRWSGGRAEATALCASTAKAIELGVEPSSTAQGVAVVLLSAAPSCSARTVRGPSRPLGRHPVVSEADEAAEEPTAGWQSPAGSWECPRRSRTSLARMGMGSIWGRHVPLPAEDIAEGRAPGHSEPGRQE